MNRGSGLRLGITLAVAVLAVPLLLVLIVIPSDGGCTNQSAGAASTANGFTANQTSIARTAIAVGRARHISDTGITAALLAAGAESDFRNLANVNVPESLRYDHDAVGDDHDSVGPWQIRASLHGTDGIAGLMDPVHQAHWFYDQLDGLPGWQTMTPEAIAQGIERSAVPDAYSRQIDRATDLLAAIGASIGIPVSACAVAAADADGFGAAVLAAARRWIGYPYVWGGGDENGPTSGGFDCSGLVLYAVYQASGGHIALPHYTQAQQDDPRGAPVDRANLRPGDLIYFTSPGQNDSHHVAIYAGNVDGDEMVLQAPTFGVPVGYGSLSGWSGERWDIRRFGAVEGGTSP